MINNKFRVWMPIEKLEKAVSTKDGKKVMRLGGIASTSDKDTDGQNLMPSGFDISYLKSRGFINWCHNKNPDSYIGEPSKAEITKAGLYVEADLYPDSDLAKGVYKLAGVLQKNSSKRRLGFSIEGKALEFDPLNENKVTKAMITGIAITPSPKNPTSLINIIKGDADWKAEPEEELFDEFVVTPNGIKELDTEKGIKDDDDDSISETIDERKITKGEVFDRIFELQPVITLEKAHEIYEKIKIFAMSTKNKKLTDSLLEKAIDVLDLNKGIGEDEKTKGGSETVLNKAKTKKKKTDDDDDDEEDDEMEDIEKGIGDEEEEDDEQDDREDRKPKKAIKKAITTDTMKDNSVAILKAIANTSAQAKNQFQAVGMLIKSVMDELSESREENELLKGEIDKLNGRLEAIDSKVDEFSFAPVGRKSIAKAIDRPFEKGMDGNGNAVQENKNTLSLTRNRPQVLSLLDKLAFEKGFDNQLANDMQSLEAGGTISPYSVEKIKGAGISLVK